MTTTGRGPVPRRAVVATRWSRVAESSRLFDLLAVALIFVVMVAAATDPSVPGPTWLSVGAAVLASVALVWRREHPEVVLAIAIAAGLVIGNALAAMLAFATVVTHMGATRRTAIWTVAMTVALLGREVADDTQVLVQVYAWGLTVALPGFLGLYVRSHREFLAAAMARNEQLSKAQSAQTERARAEERARIAREMHDVVAHRVSLIALHAGALEFSESGTPAADAAAVIRETAHRALDELRQAVGVLRSDGAPPTPADRTPQPTLDAVPALVAEWVAAGADVALTDEIAGATPGVSATAGRTVYRVVQEALTNASKHAAGAPVRVTLRNSGPWLEVRVANGAARRDSSRSGSGAGVGLFGLRERLDLVGGRLDAGPDEGGGYVLRAAVPVEQPA